MFDEHYSHTLFPDVLPQLTSCTRGVVTETGHTYIRDVNSQ